MHVISAPAAGGAEVYVKDLAKELITQGHKVHIGFIDHADAIGRSIEFERKFLQELELAGIDYFFIGRSVRRMPWLGVWRIHRYVKRHQIDIYHAHLTYAAVFGALVRVPRIYTHHNIKMRLSRFAFSVVGRAMDHLVGISEICAEALSKYTDRTVTIILNAVDSSKLLQISSVASGSEEDFRCISVGTICGQKNYEYAIDALALIDPNVRSRIVFNIAGEGSEEATSNLVSHIRLKGVGRNVRLLGNRKDVPELLSQSHLYLMSSDYEGLPIALIEATLSGLPCVVTDVGGCREVVNLCKNGILVERSDAKKLAAAITRLILDTTMRERYSANALLLSTAFLITRSCTEHLNLYRKALRLNRDIQSK